MFTADKMYSATDSWLELPARVKMEVCHLKSIRGRSGISVSGVHRWCVCV